MRSMEYGGRVPGWNGRMKEGGIKDGSRAVGSGQARSKATRMGVGKRAKVNGMEGG